MNLMTILIIIYHAKWTIGNAIYDNTINKYDNFGVDVFVFVPGFDLEYSLTKNDHFETYIFERILPAFYTFEIINKE